MFVETTHASHLSTSVLLTSSLVIAPDAIATEICFQVYEFPLREKNQLDKHGAVSPLRQPRALCLLLCFQGSQAPGRSFFITRSEPEELIRSIQILLIHIQHIINGFHNRYTPEGIPQKHPLRCWLRSPESIRK